ncbi:FG-GAP-like repeat-containing protein [Polymorphospora rubra]|uniref:Uncharacterized protein n=1 Tax=Polymorphospora rubra TaxID=338584 RepID=A0A810MRI4_9ACTN|nr:FG-GAP-like repeat-containing protein [Polymorphospora rubra]BCJ63671.1 hypothetical protein Prubr_06920 [Polymorphospora rubra]
MKVLTTSWGRTAGPARVALGLFAGVLLLAAAGGPALGAPANPREQSPRTAVPGDAPPANGVVAAAQLGEPTTRDEILARARTWVDVGVPYSQAAYHNGYRTDCSGYVSMAWNLPTSLNTGNLDQIADRISYHELRPGDMLMYHYDEPWEGHAAIFVGWTGAVGGDFRIYEQTTPSTKNRTWSAAGYSRSLFQPYRYRHVIEGEGQTQFADMNADRVADLVQVRGNGDVVVYWNVGGVYTGANRLVAKRFRDYSRLQFADLNGDGVADMVQVRGTGDVVVHWNVGGVFNGSNRLVATGFTDAKRTRFADMNADGLADLVQIRKDGNVVVYWNVGGSFDGSNALVANGFTDPGSVKFADLNADGVADLVQVRDTGQVVVYWNVGGTFNGSNRLVATGFTEPARTKFAHLDADGVADLVQVRDTGQVVVYWNVGGIYDGSNRLVANGFTQP